MLKQRVFKNNGKRFEEDFKASFSNYIWTYRPPDIGGGILARFTQESLCDLIAFNTKTKKIVFLRNIQIIMIFPNKDNLYMLKCCLGGDMYENIQK